MVEMRGLTKLFPVRKNWKQILTQPFTSEMQTAVKGVSLSIARGEFFGLLGPNGAGKTTLFKMLATLILPDSGMAEVGGRNVVSEPDAVREMLTPVVPDERSLYWRLNAVENLRLFAVLQGLTGRVADERVQRSLEQVDLTETADKMVGQFSSGMKQRLLIARALLAEPEVLLLDEPTRSLDPLSARAFRAFLRDEIADRQGRTVLLATHNPEEALELCDRLAVLHHGELLATGTVSELRSLAGDDVYRASVKPPVGWTESQLWGREGAHDVALDPEDESGWRKLELRVPGGAEQAARVLAVLAADGMQVSRFEPARLTLAELLERIVELNQPRPDGTRNGADLALTEAVATVPDPDRSARG